MPYVQELLPYAKQELKTLSDNDPIAQAHELLRAPGAQMIVVCSEDMTAVGALTQSDILDGLLGRGDSPETRCSSQMSANFHACIATDSLESVWKTMSANNLDAMPVLDSEGRPIGLVAAKCVLVKLLSVARNEDRLMREYINGMGYH